LETILDFIPHTSVIFYAYFYFSFLRTLFLRSHSVLLFRPSSCETWIKKLVLHSFPQDEGGRDEGEVARQQAATWFLIISRLAVMMQTPLALFIDCNSHYQKHRNTD